MATELIPSLFADLLRPPRLLLIWSSFFDPQGNKLSTPIEINPYGVVVVGDVEAANRFVRLCSTGG